MFRWTFLTILVVLGWTSEVQAQSDSTQSKTMMDSVSARFGVLMCDTLPQLADSIFSALKTRKFESLIKYVATADMIKEEFDTLDLEYLNRLAGVKATYMLNQLRKQHIKMTKYAKVYHLNLKNMTLVSSRVRSKVHQEGHTYGEVIYLCESGSHRFYITFIAIKILNRWFIADELGIEEITVPSGRR